MTRVVFVGPHLGGHPGRVPSPAQDLLPLLESEGDAVRLSSRRISAAGRCWEHLRDLTAWRSWCEVAVVSIFSGRSFVVAELVSRYASMLGLQQVHFLHGGALPELIGREPRRVLRVVRRADAVVAPSSWLADAVAPLGVEATVIPNVLDLGRYEYSARSGFADPAAPRLLWMRTFHDLYQPQLALRALAHLRGSGLGASLTLAGQDKGLESACRRLAVDLGVAEHVRFAGFLDAAGKRDAFSRHDVFLNTNRVDNTPVTVLEAMASGMPVVATAVGGVPCLLDFGRAGRLVADGEPEPTAQALADEVAALARGAGVPTVADLSQAGRRIAERSAWPAVRGLWRDLFARLAGASGAA